VQLHIASSNGDLNLPIASLKTYLYNPLLRAMISHFPNRPYDLRFPAVLNNFLTCTVLREKRESWLAWPVSGGKP